MIEAKAFRTIIRIYSQLKSERLSANIKLFLYKALIRSVMIYACPAWELAAGTHPLKLKVLCTIENFPRCAPIRDLNRVFNLPRVYDYITKMCRRQAEYIQNHENEYDRGEGEDIHRK
jgi:hypothetical protein